ncbi:MAG: hypothetical protein JWO80_4579 [Bryobacterales bacterium]|nr:hypothetical protein [Bryobacterales bacterium]
MVISSTVRPGSGAKTIKMTLSVLVCSLFLVATSSSGAQEREPSVTGFFTDMRYVRESGDLVGTEVWIMKAGGGRYYAAVQDAEGGPRIPVVVPVEVSGSRITFTIKEHLVDQDGRPATDLVIKYDGIVTRAGLSGMVNSEPLKLKRGKSYWQ